MVPSSYANVFAIETIKTVTTNAISSASAKERAISMRILAALAANGLDLSVAFDAVIGAGAYAALMAETYRQHAAEA